ncbi:ABC-2 family transporter protein [Bacillus mycoides]|uniref:ABC transporter permease n=1 Tax=Bacillus mycoides TaxID=1405 RepID=A0A1S9T138_BACMY|nr:ABC-2 family transporter protein [Bacillus mycoides]OOR03677.1 ABC transporter permease [Bacillus mycoides]
MFKKIIRYSSLYLQYFKKHIKVIMEYKIDFLIGSASIIMQQLIAIFFLQIIFNHIEKLNGWNFYEMLFIYALAYLGRSIHHIFFDNLWTLGWGYIRTGDFDRLLLRPVNPLFQLVSERVQQDGLGQIIVGGIVLFISSKEIGLQFNFSIILLLLLMIISSGIIFISINLFFISFSFWIVDSIALTSSVFQLNEYAQYPINIYNKYITFVITWIIPYGFTAFYPASYIIKDKGFIHIGALTPLIAIISFIIAYRFWKYGIRNYTSTGN